MIAIDIFDYGIYSAAYVSNYTTILSISVGLETCQQPPFKIQRRLRPPNPPILAHLHLFTLSNVMLAVLISGSYATYTAYCSKHIFTSSPTVKPNTECKDIASASSNVNCL